MKRVVIRKPDLDTCLTGLLLGVTPDDEIVVAPQGASEADLHDPAVLCIEAGGNGQVHLNNFDHHDPEAEKGKELPPACVQAFTRLKEEGRLDLALEPALERLVEYVAIVDTDPTQLQKDGRPVPQPTLSALFSGLLLVVQDPKERFLKGMDLLRTVLEEGIDPFGAMPSRPEWEPYLAAKRRNEEALERAQADAKIFRSRGGRTVGYLETEAVGALGLLYNKLGCQVAIACHPRFGNPPVRKYTIATCDPDLSLEPLLRILNEREPGWGGRRSIIGSPTTGSRLHPTEVIEIVQEHL